MGWDSDPVTDFLIGDPGPWGRHVAAAWQAAAGLGVPVDPPADPTEDYRQEGASNGEVHGDWVAYWAPLVQLTSFGLGWTRTDVGLSRWIDAGRPTEDPVLAVIERWWGAHLEAYLAGAWGSLQALGQVLTRRGDGTYLRFDDRPLSRRPSRSFGTSAGLWDGGVDPMHTQTHAQVAISDDGWDQPVPPGWSQPGPPRIHRDKANAVLVLDRYSGWYRHLWTLNDEARTAEGRSLRVDVVIKPIGWLGEYRRSTETGAWFRGRHKWHTLGA